MSLRLDQRGGPVEARNVPGTFAILPPIDRTEKGAPLDKGSPLFAWTGATAVGTGSDPSKRCLSWTIGTKDEVGRRGALRAIDFTWSSAGDVACSLPARLICVEQI